MQAGGECDIDHTIPYQANQPADEAGETGKTSSCNCGPRCRRHHRLKTIGGWTLEQHPDGSTTWTSPTGRSYHSPATDHRPGGP